MGATEGAALSTTAAAGARGPSLAGNSFWALLGQAVSKLASFVFVALVARALGTVEYGQFNFAISFVPLFLALGAWGLDVVVIREVAREPRAATRLFANGLLARAGLGVVAVGLAIAIAPAFLESTQGLVALAIVGVALFADEIANFIGAIFRGLERMALYAVVIVVNRLVSTALAVGVVVLGGGLIAVAVTYLVGSLIALIAGAILFVRTIGPIRLAQANSKEAMDLLGRGFPLGVADALNMAALRIDAIMVQAIRGPVGVAMYGVAFRLFESLLFIAWSFATVALPRMSRSRSPESAAKTFDLMLAVTLAFYLPVAAIAPFAGSWIVTTIFSDRYAAAAPAFAWLSVALVLYGIAHMARVGSIGLGRRKAIARIAGGTLAANIAMNAVLIPHYGFVGAAAATAVTEAIESTLLVGVLYRSLRGTHPTRTTLAPILAAATTVGVLVTTGARDLSALVVGTIVYVAALCAAAYTLSPAGTREIIRFLRPKTNRDLSPPPGT